MTVSVTRTEHMANDLRLHSAGADNAAVVRRLLALALVLDGRKHVDAARLAGMDRQTLRDWVHRYNTDCIVGLEDRHSGGSKPRLSAAQEGEVANWA